MSRSGAGGIGCALMSRCGGDDFGFYVEKSSLAPNLYPGLVVIDGADDSVHKKLLKGLRSLLYPPHCGSCGCSLDEHDPEQTLCEPCLAKISLPPGEICKVCSHPMMGLLLCPNCDGRFWQLTVIVAGCRYEGLARELIQRFKYGRDQSLMRPLGDLMMPALRDPRLAGKEFDAIVPVPLHPAREREREFNQATLLSLRLARHLDLPVKHLIKRNRVTMPQAGFDRTRRLLNLEGAFDLTGRVEGGIRVLLVDDVTTTGTTLDSCASVLMQAGADEVCAVTVARG